jgi:hypothetical protein
LATLQTFRVPTTLLHPLPPSTDLLFCVGATFEMRTVLYGIGLLIDNMIMHDRVYIQTQTVWGESRIVERQRKREGERRSIAENEKWCGQQI